MVSSHLASMTFCWLPPDSLPTSIAVSGDADRQTLAVGFGHRGLGLAVDQAEGLQEFLARLASEMLAKIGSGMARPSLRRSSET